MLLLLLSAGTFHAARDGIRIYSTLLRTHLRIIVEATFNSIQFDSFPFIFFFS